MKKMKWKLNIRRVDVERMLVLCASALVVALALRQDQPAVPDQEAPLMNTPVISDATLISAAETQPTVVYYQDGEGYLVPVTRQVDKTDGIAKATLNLMVQTSANDLAAARSRAVGFVSLEDVGAACPKVSQTHIETLRALGAFGEMPETSQMSFF